MNWGKNLTMIVFSLVMLLFSYPVNASSFEFHVFPTYVSVCPCTAVTPQDIQMSIKNLYQYPDTYTFTLQAPSGWVSQIQLDAALDPGEEKAIDLFLVQPVCNTPPGTYTVTVTVTSGMTGEKESRDIVIEVLNCYDVDLYVSGPYRQEMCSETMTSLVYNMNIANNGKYVEELELSADKEWVTLSQRDVVVAPGEIKDIDVTVTPPENLRGVQKIYITARSKTSYVTDVEEIELVIKDCYNFDAQLVQKEVSACVKEPVTFNLILTNNGLENDSYTIFVPDWVIPSQQTVDVPPNQAREIELTVIPEQKGKLGFDISIYSSSDPQMSKTVHASLDVSECRGLAIIASPVSKDVCKDTTETFEVSVKNTGSLEDKITLTTTLGTLDKESLIIEPGETKTVYLTVDAHDLEEGNYSIIVKATSSNKDVFDEAEIDIKVINCYDASLQIIPERSEICSCSTTNYEVVLTNKGELKDTYTLRVMNYYLNYTRQVELSSGESKRFNFTITPPMGAQPGEYSLDAYAISEHTSVEAHAVLVLKPAEECYKLDMKPSKESVVVEICNATTIEVTLKNTGEKETAYNLSVSGPEWVSIEPNFIELQPGEEGIAYFYVTPPLGVETGAYTAGIHAESFHGSFHKNLAILVVSNITEYEESISEINKTEKEEEGVKLNATIGENITGLLVGEEQKPTWKLIAIAVITLTIIAILLVRFVFLVR